MKIEPGGPIQRNTPLGIIAAALLLLSAGVAIAQDTPTTNQSAQPTPSSVRSQPTPTPSPGQTAAEGEVERVVVTAEKREENIQEVPSSISVINDVELDNLHATQLTDYAPYIPGLQVNSVGTPGQTAISLRGLAPISSGATVGTYIDETPVGSSGLYQAATNFELDLLPYDIRRVEVLRGPQGTLYGANSIGGLIKYVTLDPSLSTPEFHVGGGVSGVEHSGDPGWDVHASANVPLANDHLGLRLSYSRNEIPGFIDNAVNGQKGINDGTQEGALIALLWQPNDNIRLKFTALGQRIESDNNALVALDAKTRQPIFGDLTNQVFVDEPFTKKLGLISATLDLNLGWADFTSATAYSNTRTDQRIDATVGSGQIPLLLGSTATGIAAFNLGLNLDKFSQEIRLTSKPDGRFLWQLGAFYTYERADQTQSETLRQLDGTKFVGPLAVLNTLFVAEIPSRYNEYAAFANASYKFTDRLSLRAGLRFARNEQTFAQVISNGGIFLPNGVTPGKSNENVFDYMVSPELKLAKDKLLYARIATGYQPGGPNVAVPGVPPSVAATTDTSYELGFKSEFADHRVLFDIAGYHIDLSDIQVGKVVNNVGALVNGGEATSNGVEATIGYQPIKALSFGINGAYTHATLSNDVPSLEGREGDRLPFIPEFSASATVDYYVALSSKWNGHVGAGYRWVGDQLSEVESSSTAVRTPSYGALDLNADVSNGHCTIRVFAKNVTDERAYPTIGVVTDLFGTVDHLTGVPIQPRTVGIEFDLKF